jgi:hypothetical protein
MSMLPKFDKCAKRLGRSVAHPSSKVSNVLDSPQPRARAHGTEALAANSLESPRFDTQTLNCTRTGNGKVRKSCSESRKLDFNANNTVYLYSVLIGVTGKKKWPLIHRPELAPAFLT